MNRWLLMGAFGVLAMAQWAAPASMIYQHEAALTQGEPIKIKCQPIDPADPFRGRYVTINLDLGAPRLPEGEALLAPEKRWVTLEPDEEGFYRWGVAHAERPASGVYTQAEVWMGWQNDGESLQAVQPLDRFYMNEWRAPEAEAAYFDAMRETPANCYVLVRVRNGLMVFEELYLDGLPIGEYLQKRDDSAGMQ